MKSFFATTLSLFSVVFVSLVTSCSAQTPLVSLDATDASATTAAWKNTGTLGGEFTRGGAPKLETFGGIQAISFDGKQDWFRGPNAPAALLGNSPRTVEMWVWNPTLDSDEETLLSWGHRGGPAGTAWSFNWGKSPNFGASTHWANDLGWSEIPNAGHWHLLAYTSDGKTVRVFDNGVESASRPVALNTASGPIQLAVQNASDGTPLWKNEANGTQLAGSFSLASLHIYDMALTPAQIRADFEAQRQRFGATAPHSILDAGRDTFQAGPFSLSLLRATGTATSLTLPKEGFDFLPSDRLSARAKNGFVHLGDLRLRWRSGTGDWQSADTAQGRGQDARAVSLTGALAAQDISASLGDNIPLQVIREWRVENGELRLRFHLRNTSNGAIEIGALGTPMAFNNILTGRSLDEAHEKCSLADPYIGGDAGYVQVSRLDGKSPVLLVAPEAKTPFEAYTPLHDDPTPRDVTFEGFYEWTVHTRAYAQNEWKNATPWNTPTSRVLPPNQEATYGFRFFVSPSIHQIEDTLAAHGRPVAVTFPSPLLPLDQTGRLFVRSSSPVKSVTVEPAGAFVLKADAKPLANGWRAYTVRSLRTGQARITLSYADGQQQFVQYRATLPAATQVSNMGLFHANKQWFSDPSDPFGRTNSFLPYDREHNQIVLQRENSWPVGLSDEMGAGPSVAMAMKNLGQPDADQIALLERYVNGTLWGRLQNPDYGVKASLFFYEPAKVPGYKYTIHGGWDKARGETTWRSYNYPHVTAVYWALYHLARDHQGLVKQQDWQWYLDHAFNTVMGMKSHAGGLDQFGLMVGTVFPELLRDLKREGWNDKAARLEAYMKERESHWARLRFPFGSEMPWDSTGQEEVYSWSKYFDNDDKAQVTLDAITAYLPTVPNWAYNGAGRRYFDEAVNNTRWPDVVRITNHYGSPLNAIPVLDAFRRNPSDIYLLRTGYAGAQQPLANIDNEGFASGNFDADPAILAFDPFSSDYGVGFWGYALNEGTYVIHQTTFGWLGLGGDVRSIATGALEVIPRDGFRQRVFLAPLNLWITLDAGTIESVRFNPTTRAVSLTLSPSTSATPSARLRLNQSALGNLPARWTPQGKFALEREAIVVPLKAKNTTIELRENH
ncbi:hypothetical protein IAD21_05239 [Abditibacteriota bacterium]|nr:hypothetical protein IAD21_05239 [Abditibacteriota bacterium]